MQQPLPPDRGVPGDNDSVDGSAEEPVFNPVDFVCGGTPKKGIERALTIAAAAKDSFSIGEAVVDGWIFYHYATGARRLVGIP